MDEIRTARRGRRKMQGVTMAEVAGAAGVSASTVSLYFRRPEGVSPVAREAIARAVADLGYAPNPVAGGLAAAGSRIVSLIVPSVRNAFFAETVAALEAALAPHALQVLLGHTEYDLAREEALVRAALSWAPAAVVLTGLQHAPATRALLQGTRVPVVEIWERGPPPIDMGVGFSHPEVGAAMARRLIGRGRRRIAFCGARLQQDRRAAQRADGFLVAARAEGVAAAILDHPGPADPQAGASLLDRALREMDRLDGIGASNDLVALGALFEAQRRAIAVPHALALVGFGDMPFAAACVPPLTTIRPAGDRVGAEAARLVLARMRGEAPLERAIDTGHVLVERVSG